MAAQGARLIGGCCGTTPRTIAAMAAALAGLEPTRSKTIRAVVEAERPPATPKVAPTEESLLDRIAAGHRVIICELDPPKTLALEKYFTGAQALVQAGCDAITLADNSLAILRVSNLAIGAMLKERFGITPLLHMSCRDRNVLGLQSELLGMAALGMRHVLPLTGDPARVGDHPGAASVYDVNSVQLIGIIKRMNEGFNYAGKSLSAGTQFVMGCTFNPNSKNLDAQISRLERKIAAGAQYVMTQPVFDLRVLDEMVRRTREFGVPDLHRSLAPAQRPAGGISAQRSAGDCGAGQGARKDERNGRRRGRCARVGDCSRNFSGGLRAFPRSLSHYAFLKIFGDGRTGGVCARPLK